MPCIDTVLPWRGLTAVVAALLLAGCAGRPQPPAAPAAATAASPARAAALPSPSPQAADPALAGAAAPADVRPAAAAGAGSKVPPHYVKLGPPKTPRSWDELRLQAAQRLVAAHPDTTYVSAPPSILLAIPILEIELNADGTVRHIRVARVPGQAQDTTQLAIDAVRRAAPFGDVSKLKKPWKFVETFLFDDERRFMPRTLDR